MSKNNRNINQILNSLESSINASRELKSVLIYNIVSDIIDLLELLDDKIPAYHLYRELKERKIIEE